MKSILLATAASVAFAGAAAADVTFTGTAAVSYNNNAGTTSYKTEADLKASMSAELNNGLKATTSVTIAGDNFGTATTHGAIAISSDVASLTFGTGLNGAAYTAVSDTYGVGLGKEATAGIVASYKLGDTTIYASMPATAAAAGGSINSTNLELAATTTLQGWSIAGAYANDTKKIAVKVSGAVAGATVSGGFSNNGNKWDIKASYPVGPVTVSAAYDEAKVYVLGASYSADGVTVAAEYTKGGAWKADASYAYGSGVNLFAGIADKGKDLYIGATYDLGGGATLTGSYGKDADNSAADKIGAKEYARGATVKVSFAF